MLTIEQLSKMTQSKMTNSERLSYKKRTNKHEQSKSRKYKIGEKVIGRRSPDAYIGELLEVYVTINNGFRNMAYKIKCDVDGKTRSFQILSKIDKKEEIEKTFRLR